MHIDYHRRDDLPRLSWLCELHRSRPVIYVYHGPWVEARHHFFVEGAWAGDFAAGDFHDRFFFGSGGRLCDDGLLLTPPDHMLDRLFLSRTADTVRVSNSLAFLLYRMEDRLDPKNLFYNWLFVSSRDGFRRAGTECTTLNGNTIRLCYFNSILIGPDLALTVREKSRPTEFSDYAGLVDYMTRILAAVQSNAADPARTLTYSPVCTLSLGYDSAAAAVLSRAMGNRTAISFPQGRGGNANDSGRAIADRLGLDLIERDRLAYLDSGDMPEIETYGSPCEMASIRDCLEGRIMLTGVWGDTVWERKSLHRTNEMVRSTAGGSNYTELKNRVGFILLPVPSLCATCLPQTRAVTASAEMRPWTLFTDYDRPIPRRMIEEAGIERGTFAVRKQAAGVFATEEGLDRTMTRRARADFETFVRQNWNFGTGVRTGIFSFLHRIYDLNARLRDKIGRVRLFGMTLAVPQLMPPVAPLSKLSLLFHWSTDRMIERYRAALADVAPASDRPRPDEAAESAEDSPRVELPREAQAGVGRAI